MPDRPVLERLSGSPARTKTGALAQLGEFSRVIRQIRGDFWFSTDATVEPGRATELARLAALFPATDDKLPEKTE